MLEYKKGDIFQSDCEAITNAVNALGVMGAGLALAFKRRYPQMNKEYIQVCKQGKLRPGIMHVWENPNAPPKYIINFPTKDDLSPSKLEYVVGGLKALKEVIEEKNIKSIALCALGCGLGGLRWNDVKLEIEKFANDIPEIKVLAYEPL